MRTKTNQMQDKILTAITGYIATHGYSPTVREIGEMVGYRSPSSVHKHIKIMVEGGLLVDAGAPRTIRPAGQWRTEMDKADLYRQVLFNLFTEHLYETIELYGREHDVRELEYVLSDFGISSNALDGFIV